MGENRSCHKLATDFLEKTTVPGLGGVVAVPAPAEALVEQDSRA
ncbi:hypothetical protein [Pseudarthrobacter cellobiosi]|nr:hypothetical protein [Pseudarthrobacter sp. HLT3-5]